MRVALTAWALLTMVLPSAAHAHPMKEILDSHPGLQQILGQAESHRLQVIIGEVETDGDGVARLVQRSFRAGDEYFYPASAVKLFAAVAALERLAELRRETGLAVNVDTPLVYHPLFDDEELESKDPDHRAAGTITVRQQIRELLLVSDNLAFNRLYELVGQDRLYASMAAAGLPETRIVHRLSEFRSAEENRQSPRIDLVGADFRFSLPERTGEPLPAATETPGLEIGSGFASGDEIREGPTDFSGKNRIALTDLQGGLCMVVRPDVDCGGPGYDLTPADRQLLLEPMSRYPRQSLDPVYDPDDYPDHFAKFLLLGLVRVLPKERWTIYNKIGQAYGFTTENAYVVDESTGRSFFLAATLYTNANGVLNDNEYEYVEVAQPFLADLGEAVARALFGTD